MFIIENTGLAIGVCLLAMLCWGSWSNAQKVVTGQQVPVSLFYRDYVLGILLWAIVAAFTLGSFGRFGRSFLTDLHQADWSKLGLALAAGVVFNLGNQLLVAGIQAAGLAIAMPVGTGIALALGLVVNYLAEPDGNLPLLAVGGVVVLASIACSALAYRAKEQHADKSEEGKADQASDDQKEKKDSPQKGGALRGLLIAGVGGIVNGFFYRLVTASLAEDFANPAPGQLTPYTALVVFALGITVSNPLFTLLLRHFADPPDARMRYGELSVHQHGIGILGGLGWGLGMLALLLASIEAGAAISFGLSQGATIVGVLWGLFAWHEFVGAPPVANRWLWAMGASYVVGVGLIVAARLL